MRTDSAAIGACGEAPPELSRRERRKLEVHERLVDAARVLFQAHGFAATRIAQICERADVAEKTFFNHFPSKQDLLRELAAEGLDALLESIESARRRGDSTRSRIALFFQEAAEAMADGGPPQRELVTELVHAAHAAADPSEQTRRLHEAVGRVVADGLEAGDVTRLHDPETLTEMILGAYYVLAFNFVNLDAFPVRRQADAVARFLADALAPRGGECADGTPARQESTHGPA